MTAGHEFECIFQAWCREVLPAARSAWALKVTEVPIRVEQRGQLNAMIDGMREAPRITISEGLIKVLSIFNINTFRIGWKMLFEQDPMISASEPLMRDVLALVFAMDPPGAPPPSEAARFTKPGFEEYRRQYESWTRSRLGDEGTNFFVKITGSDNDVAAAVAGLERIAEKDDPRPQKIRPLLDIVKR